MPSFSHLFTAHGSITKTKQSMVDSQKLLSKSFDRMSIQEEFDSQIPQLAPV